MTAYSISLTIGDGNIGHNSNSKRRKRLENVDAERTKENVTIVHNPIRKAYHELFDEAVDQYNKSQKRADRHISDYYSKIYNSKKEKPFYEFVIQVGNMDNHPNLNITNEIYTEFVKKIQLKYPQIYVFGAYIHNDEASPHLHLDYIPFAYYEKGLNKRVSLSRSMSQMGYSFKESDRSKGLYKAFRTNLVNDLEQICIQHDIQRENMHNTEKHEANVQLFKQRASLKREVNELTTEKQTISRSVAHSQSELADINRDIENKMQQLDSLEKSIVNNPIIQLTNDKEILEILDKAKRDIDDNNNYYSRIDSREINKAIPKFDDSWLEQNIEVVEPKKDLFGREKEPGYIKISAEEWEKKKSHKSSDNKAFHKLENMFRSIESKYNSIVDQYQNALIKLNARIKSIEYTLSELIRLPIVGKWSEIKKNEQMIPELVKELNQSDREKNSLARDLLHERWYHKFYDKVLPFLAKSKISDGRNTLDVVLGSHDDQDRKRIANDLKSFQSQYKEIIYYKGTCGYGWYASQKDGGAYLGKKADLTILKEAYPKAIFRDPHGHINIKGIYR